MSQIEGLFKTRSRPEGRLLAALRHLSVKEEGCRSALRVTGTIIHVGITSSCGGIAEG
jgi:hypothetical protein